MRGRRGNRSQRAVGGYTMMEALIALILLLIGILGMGALAGSTVSSNMNAQDRTQAMYLCKMVHEMLKTEAFSWNSVDWTPDTETNAVGTYMPLLSLMPNGTTTGSVGPVELTKRLQGTSYAFTSHLEQIAPNLQGAKFCVHYSLSWRNADSMYADVTVYWTKRGRSNLALGFYNNCGQGVEATWENNIVDLWAYNEPVTITRNNREGVR